MSAVLGRITPRPRASRPGNCGRLSWHNPGYPFATAERCFRPHRKGSLFSSDCYLCLTCHHHLQVVIERAEAVARQPLPSLSCRPVAAVKRLPCHVFSTILPTALKHQPQRLGDSKCCSGRGTRAIYVRPQSLLSRSSMRTRLKKPE